MATTREYRVVINGVATTAMLSEVDAKRMKAVPVDAPPVETVTPVLKARPVFNAGRTPPNKAG